MTLDVALTADLDAYDSVGAIQATFPTAIHIESRGMDQSGRYHFHVTLSETVVHSVAEVN